MELAPVDPQFGLEGLALGPRRKGNGGAVAAGNIGSDAATETWALVGVERDLHGLSRMALMTGIAMLANAEVSKRIVP